MVEKSYGSMGLAHCDVRGKGCTDTKELLVVRAGPSSSKDIHYVCEGCLMNTAEGNRILAMRKEYLEGMAKEV